MSPKMKVSALLFTVVVCVATSPVDVDFPTPDKVEWSKLRPKAVYVDIVNSTDIHNYELPPGSSRIVGGDEVVPNSVPYQVAIIIDGVSLCGGSLISTTCVLTAAHCTTGASFIEVRLGAHHFDREEATQVRVTSTSVVIHESYNSYAVANDISIVFVPSITFNDHIQAVPLVAADSGTFEGQTGLLAGWGRTSDASNAVSSILRSVKLDVISNAACRNIFGSLITSSILCTSGAGAVGACNGDSGGALVVGGVEVGIAAFGSAFCEGGTPTGFARISSFRKWIQEHAGV